MIYIRRIAVLKCVTVRSIHEDSFFEENCFGLGKVVCSDTTNIPASVCLNVWSGNLFSRSFMHCKMEESISLCTITVASVGRPEWPKHSFCIVMVLVCACVVDMRSNGWDVLVHARCDWFNVITSMILSFAPRKAVLWDMLWVWFFNAIWRYILLENDNMIDCVGWFICPLWSVWAVVDSSSCSQPPAENNGGWFDSCR